MDEDPPIFKSDTLKEIFELDFDKRTRISAVALTLSSEYLRFFTREVLERSVAAAREEQDEKRSVAAAGEEKGERNDDMISVEVKHIEKVITSVILDF